MQDAVTHNAHLAADDEIDLFELWQGLVEEKWTIFIALISVVVIAAGYAFSVKPVYSGNALIELGSIAIADKANNSALQPIESPESLALIVQTLTGVSASVPQQTKLLTLSLESQSKETISPALQACVNLVLERHAQLSKNLNNAGIATISPSLLIGNIAINDAPIKPKKSLIIAVGAVLGLMLGVFIALIRRAVKKRTLDKTDLENTGLATPL